MWDNPGRAREVLQKKSNLEKQLAELNYLENEYKNLVELYEMSPDDPDIISAVEKLSDAAHRAKFITLFSDPLENNGAF